MPCPDTSHWQPVCLKSATKKHPQGGKNPSPVTCGLYLNTPNPWHGVKGLPCCTAAVENLGKAFSPAAKPKQENLTQIHHLPSQQDPSCSAQLHLISQFVTGCFQWLQKEFAKKIVLLFEWNILRLYVPLSLPSDSCWFSSGGKAASEIAETIWCKRQA